MIFLKFKNAPNFSLKITIMNFPEEIQLLKNKKIIKISAIIESNHYCIFHYFIFYLRKVKKCLVP